jgi:cytochrome c-type biogenesis protein CcmE
MRRRWFGWGATALILGTMGFLVWGGIDSNIVYFLTPSELLAKGTESYDRPVRLGGQVVPGALEGRAAADGRRRHRRRPRGALRP